MYSEEYSNDESQPIESSLALDDLTLEDFLQRPQYSVPNPAYSLLRYEIQRQFEYPPYCMSPSHMNPTMYPTTYSVTPPNPNAYFSPTEEPPSYASLFSHREFSSQERYQGQRTYENDSQTVTAIENFDPINDAFYINNTLMSNDVDKDIIINIICNRSLEQRIVIAQEYKNKYGDILHDFKAKLSGKFKNIMLSLITPLDILTVQDLYKSLQCYDFNVVPEIICTLSNEELSNLKSMFERSKSQAYGKTVDSYIKKKASACCKKFLMEICKCMRDESNVLNYEQAEEDAKLLYNTLLEDLDNDFFEIFSKRSFPQIKLTCEIYEELFLHSIDRKIKNIFTFYDQQGYLVVSRFACNEQEYYAKRLRQSMKGLGTNNEQLIRIIVTRSEIDLGDIKKAFHRLFNGTLKEWIEDDTSGHYKDALLTLIRE